MTHAQLALTCAGPVLIEFLSAAKTMLSFKLQNGREQHPIGCHRVLSMQPRVARMMRNFLNFFNDESVTSKSFLFFAQFWLKFGFMVVASRNNFRKSRHLLGLAL